MNGATISALLAQCRAGFEAEALEDLRRIARPAIVGPETATAGNGYAIARFVTGRAISLDDLARAATRAAPVFARSIVLATGPQALVNETGKRVADRVTPLLAAIEPLRALAPFASCWIEFPDTNDGKALSPLARSLEARVGQRMRDLDALADAPGRPRLHVFLATGQLAWIGVDDARFGSPWPMGIPRLRMPHGAPSRSTLKLAEAFETLLGDRADSALREGMHAVDLGAAPGGWSWQLARRGLHVTAVDNGALRSDVAIDPRVHHVRNDGFTFRPRHPVDWLTCDIVDSPMRIATLVAGWIADGIARRAIFNLKLPMKKRYAEVDRCRDAILGVCEDRGVHVSLRIRQLYHDREEVTGYLARNASSRRKRHR